MADLAPGGLCVAVVGQVYAFDPTVPGLPKSAQNVTPRIQFFKQAIGPTDGSSDDFMLVRSLPSIMKELGHTYIDVLKVRRLYTFKIPPRALDKHRLGRPTMVAPPLPCLRGIAFAWWVVMCADEV